MLSNMRKGLTTHSTIDNNDGNQETMTGSGTTYDTNKTLFQLPSKLQFKTIPPVGDDDTNPFDIFDDEIFCEPIPYEIGTRSEPPLYPDYEDAAAVDSEYFKRIKFRWDLISRTNQFQIFRDCADELPYREKCRQGKVMKFWPGNENLPR